jgi:PKD repeat protein
MDYYEENILVGNANTDCEADFAFQVQEGSLNVNFTDKSKGNIVGYYWNYGDKEVGDGIAPVHNYKKSGYFNVCHLVVNNKLITNIICKPIIVSPNNTNNCLAKFEYTVDAVNKTAYFNDASEGSPTKWEWSFGDGNTDVKQNTSRLYTNTGYYLVGLRITNTATGCVNKTYKLINVGAPDIMKAGFAFEKKPYSLKAGGYPVDFIGAGLGDDAKLKWSFGDKADPEHNVDSTTTSPTHYYPKGNTQYYVCYQVSDPVTGQKDSVCQWVTTDKASEVETKRVNNSFDIYPNPFEKYVTFTYYVNNPTLVELTVFDMNGRKVTTILKTYKTGGDYKIIWDAVDIQPGVYLIKLLFKDELISSELIIKE